LRAATLALLRRAAPKREPAHDSWLKQPPAGIRA
jgi:hypothetical protein